MAPSAPGDAVTFEDQVEKPGRFKYNWRLEQLSKPKATKRTPKFDPDSVEPFPKVSRAALNYVPKMWIEQMAYPPIRRLRENKKEYGYRGQAVIDVYDKKIDETWNSIYNYYNKAMKEYEKKYGKRIRPQSIGEKTIIKSRYAYPWPRWRRKRTASQIEISFAKWAERRAQPKLPPKRSKIKRGRRIKDLKRIERHMNKMSTPLKVTPKYDPNDPFWREDYYEVKESAKTYEISERVTVLAKCPEFRKFVREEPPPNVSPAALEYVISDRVKILSEPKPKSKGPESDEKENPFAVSPNALRYIASPRMVELAKPVERG